MVKMLLVNMYFLIYKLHIYVCQKKLTENPKIINLLLSQEEMMQDIYLHITQLKSTNSFTFNILYFLCFLVYWWDFIITFKEWVPAQLLCKNKKTETTGKGKATFQYFNPLIGLDTPKTSWQAYNEDERESTGWKLEFIFSWWTGDQSIKWSQYSKRAPFFFPHFFILFFAEKKCFHWSGQ